MYLSRIFRWPRSAESNSVVNDNDASASETSFSTLTPSREVLDMAVGHPVLLSTDTQLSGVDVLTGVR